MAANKTGFYKTNFAKPVAVTVAKENKDGTVDLAGADGKVFVKSCPVSETELHGHFTSGELPEAADDGAEKAVAEKKLSDEKAVAEKNKTNK